jgi:hypothetical protein
MPKEESSAAIFVFCDRKKLKKKKESVEERTLNPCRFFCEAGGVISNSGGRM